MIGYFKTPDLVGLYSIAPPLANLNILFLTSLGALYTPIAAKLYGEGKLEDMKKSYAISTKWCFIVSFPMICTFFLFPDVILNFLYGYKYAAASGAFQILTLGVLFNSATGPNSHTLIAIGKSNVIIRAYFISSIINVALNILLIPRIGIVGAAIATSSMATELVIGKSIDEAQKITNKVVAEALDGLPPVKMHCSNLAEEALEAAIKDYHSKQKT